MDDGAPLLNALLADKKVYLSFDFPNIPTDHTLKVELWMSANNLDSYNSINKINQAFELIDSSYKFIPKYVVLERDLLSEQSKDDCVLDGHYCGPRSEDEYEKNGRDVILVNIDFI